MIKQGQISLLAWISFAFFVGWEMIAPIFPLYALDVGATLLEVGFLLSLLNLVTMLVRIPFGTIAARLGPWSIMTLACGLQAVSLILLDLAPSTPWLFIAIVLYGVSTGAFGPLAVSTVLNLATSGKRGDVSGKYYFAIGVAMFSGPIVTSVLIWFFNYRQLFFFIMLFPFSALIVLRKLASKQAVKGDDPQRMYGDETSKLEIAKQFVTLLRRKRVVVVVTVTLLFFICDGFFRTLFPIYGQEVLLFSPSAISILFAFFGGVNASVRIPSGRLSDTIGRKRPLLLSVGICTLAFAIFAQATQFSLLVLGMMAYGFAWGMRVPPSSALLADCVEPHELSIAIAYLWMSADLGFSIGAALAGSLGSAIPFPLIIQSSVILFVVSLILISIGFRDMR